ncbi:uncharacterized protein BDR25DRAFT_364019 [Lindgomyces ingoldianus]|uniref:Uncharacterized protein n=1 Tax=Lindgomyces ingoldianus TaxID=673940 RepID=A0ACB6Q7C4_9PLEO|nr:uncharacterized protein BDR25DRAFT_364019 [Lindgomyces ingoldianus]KAF2462503.1 hypothetical protein BDR25DRAFT_364019 [Lindgomyces ingoldianus]
MDLPPKVKLSADEVMKLGDIPVEPTYSDHQSGATKPSEMDAKNLSDYTADHNQWERKITEYKILRKSLARISAEISRTIALQHYFLIEDHKDAYNKLKKPHKDFDAWLSEWLQTVGQCRRANLPDVQGTRAQTDFLRTIKPLAPEFAANALLYIIEKEDCNDLAAIPSLEDYISQYRTWHRTMNPVAASIGSFATLGIAGTNQNRSRFKPGAKPLCICGSIYWFNECKYLNPTTRTKGWKPDQSIQQKVNQARKDPNINSKVLAALERDKQRREKQQRQQSAPTPINFDDGELPSSTPQSNALQQVFSTSVAVPSLINRWILDPGSNAHICNNTQYGWTYRRDAMPGEIVNTPAGLSTIKLTHVAYVEGFFANVLGLARCRSLDIHFDSGRDALYQGSSENVVCKLKYQNGHWLIDAEEMERAELSTFSSRLRSSSPELVTLATKLKRIYHRPSREERRPIIDIPEVDDDTENLSLKHQLALSQSLDALAELEKQTHESDKSPTPAQLPTPQSSIRSSESPAPTHGYKSRPAPSQSNEDESSQQLVRETTEAFNTRSDDDPATSIHEPPITSVHDPRYIPDPDQNNAPKARSLNINKSNIISENRTTRLKQCSTYFATFASSIVKEHLHRDQHPQMDSYLVQDSFINKIATKFNLEQSGKRLPDIPLRETLELSTETTNNRRTKLYQQLVGSLAYIASFTRPDIAHAHSILARHLTNPVPCDSLKLLWTSIQALWSSEAELLALSQAGTDMEWWKLFFTRLQLLINNTPTIWCDN